MQTTMGSSPSKVCYGFFAVGDVLVVTALLTLKLFIFPPRLVRVNNYVRRIRRGDGSC